MRWLSQRSWLGLSCLLAAGLVLAGCSSDSDGFGPRGTGSGSKDPLKQLEKETGVDWTRVQDEGLGTPTFLEPQGQTEPVLVGDKTADQASREFFQAHPGLFGMTDPTAELVLEQVSTDELGITHATYRQQTQSKVPVFGMRIGIHYDSEGRIAFISGKYVPDVFKMNTQAAVQPADAVQKATADLVKAKPALASQSPDTAPQANLVVYVEQTTPRLAYELQLSYHQNSLTSMTYLVDATDGSVLVKLDNVMAVQGSGGGVKFYQRNDQSDRKTFDVHKQFQWFFDSSPATYEMSLDGSSSQSAVEIRDTAGKTLESKDLDTWDATGSFAGEAADAYAYLHQVDQYYRAVHKRASYDGQGSKIVGTIHVPDAMDNAYWSWGTNQAYFGDISYFSPSLPFVGALDVVAHELQHGITHQTIDLVYQDQAGALNEAISDIFGCFVEHYYHADSSKNFLISEDTIDAKFGGALRSLKDPSSIGSNYPDHMNNFVKTSDDHGGVHTNSLIPGHAWYLMTIGGKNATSKIEVKHPIGWEDSQKLWYSAITGNTAAKTASFADMARITIATARQIRSGSSSGSAGSDSSGSATGSDQVPEPVKTVACAWYAVGVLTLDEIQSHWKVTCDEADAGAGPTLDCFTGGANCKSDQVCSWNGPGNGYCCKKPWTGTKTCFSDPECGEESICSRGANDRFYCTKPNDQPCDTN